MDAVGVAQIIATAYHSDLSVRVEVRGSPGYKSKRKVIEYPRTILDKNNPTGKVVLMGVGAKRADAFDLADIIHIEIAE